MRVLRALLWDVDGTLAETERDGHRVAFNQAFELFGLPWRWDETRYGDLLAITGGRERLMHDMRSRHDAPPLVGEREHLARQLHESKNAFYGDLVSQGGIPLRPGVLPLLRECRQSGVRMAVTTTTSRSNVEALLRVHLGEHWREWFEVLVCGEDVGQKKPSPEVYHRALGLMKLHPLDTLAIEDSPGGVAAARAANCPVLVTRSTYFADEPIEGAVAIGPGLDTLRGWRPAPRDDSPDRPVNLQDLRHWHRVGDMVSDFP